MPTDQSSDPGPARESVWDYPRPPAVRAVARAVTIHFGGILIVEADHVVEVLETSHPPTVYVARGDIRDGVLVAAKGSSWCEFKGHARYYDVVAGGRRAPSAAWFYPEPSPGYELLSGRVAFYPGPMDVCRVDGEAVRAQAGGFYGGWITSRVIGPFKGEPGTSSW